MSAPASSTMCMHCANWTQARAVIQPSRCESGKWTMCGEGPCAMHGHNGQPIQVRAWDWCLDFKPQAEVQR